jgi:hypothetical protein
MYEYPGYGPLKLKRPNEEDVYLNIRQAYNYVRNSLKIKESHIVMYNL